MIIPCMNSTSACDRCGIWPVVEGGSLLLGAPGAPGCTTVTGSDCVCWARPAAAGTLQSNAAAMEPNAGSHAGETRGRRLRPVGPNLRLSSRAGMYGCPLPYHGIEGRWPLASGWPVASMRYAWAVRRRLVLLLLYASFASAQQVQPDRLLSDAIEAQQRGDLPTAIHEYEELLKLKPDMVEVRVNLGAALADSGRFDDAIAQYRLALPRLPDKNPIRLNLGLAYYKKGDLASAAHEFEELHTVQPEDAK